MEPIAVIGAGIAGLTAADDLRKRGLPVILFEAGKTIGGMASSFKDDAGFSYDFGAHFINNRLAEQLGASAICRTVKYYGESVRIGSKTTSYPLGLLASPRYLGSALASRAKRGEIRHAADWFRQTYGERLANEVAIPLTEAWSGVPAEELAPSVGAKMGPSVLKTLYLRAAARVTQRAVCNGYAHEMPESASIYHVYPEGGVARLLDPMANRVFSSIRLGSPVEKVIVENGRVAAVRSKGETISVSAAISTAPVHVLPKLVEGTDALAHLSAFRYRPMVFVNLRFSGEKLLPDTMIWVPDRSHLFYRITEAPHSMPWLAPSGKTQITFDIACETSDPAWSMSDDELALHCLDSLTKLYPQCANRYIGAGGVLRTPISYPVFRQSHEAERLRFARTTGVDGLYSVGRNGEFGHLLMEDVYWRTTRRMAEVANYVEGLAARDAPAPTLKVA